jgi:hypothetical protein
VCPEEPLCEKTKKKVKKAVVGVHSLLPDKNFRNISLGI